jgi:hypothetical protein
LDISEVAVADENWSTLRFSVKIAVLGSRTNKERDISFKKILLRIEIWRNWFRSLFEIKVKRQKGSLKSKLLQMIAIVVQVSQ